MLRHWQTLSVHMLAHAGHHKYKNTSTVGIEGSLTTLTVINSTLCVRKLDEIKPSSDIPCACTAFVRLRREEALKLRTVKWLQVKLPNAFSR